MDDAQEDWILTIAEMTQSALAMSRAMLDDDFEEARFHAKLLNEQAAAIDDQSLEESAALVNRLLGPLGATPGLGCGAAMLALSTILGDRLHSAPQGFRSAASSS